MTRVLIVDDKEENLYYLNALLSGHGCTVVTAHHGAEALVKARQSPPDLIVSDLLMPVMDGYTLLRHWKADPRLRRVPFIVYTATYTEAEDERLALNLGADAFILKPAEPDDFLARLRAVQTNAVAAMPAPPRHPVGDENTLLRVYSETLIRKLEEKTLQLEETNRALERDIAERKIAEERIAEQAALLDQTQDAIIVRDLEHRVVLWSKGAERLYGWTAAEAVNRRVDELVQPDAGTYQEALRAVLRVGAWGGEIHTVTKTAAKITLESRWTLLRDAANRPKSILDIGTDITERKKLEQQFLRAQRMESIGTLAGGIAHDLNNLLTPILIGVGVLRLGALDDGAAQIVDNIEQSARRGTDLVKQVLSFARGVEGARVAVSLADIAREIEAITRTTFPKNITFFAAIAADIRPVTGDPTQLNQVLMNLCVNARDAMPDGGSLTIAAKNVELVRPYAALQGTVPAGHYVVLEVSDTGTGMPKPVIERIFEPFFTTKDVGKGTGLGLSTMLGIVRSHGGCVNVESAPGRGTTFKIFLPAETNSSAGPVASTGVADEQAGGQGECVLLVDDDSTVLDITRQTLETFG